MARLTNLPPNTPIQWRVVITPQTGSPVTAAGPNFKTTNIGILGSVAPVKWTFELTDNRGYPIAELTEATQRVVSLRLNRVTTGSFIVSTNNPLINTVRLGAQVHIKAYRNGQLMANGPLVPGYSKQVSGGSQAQRTCQINWSGVGWRLSRRIIEDSKSDTGVTYPVDPNFTQDRGDIAVSIINGLNNASPPASVVPQSAMDTGIRIGSVTPSSSTQYGPVYYKNALEAISELSASLDGFDWELVPVEPVADSLGVKMAVFNASGAIGSTRADVVWEYGDGKFNVTGFTEQMDASGQMNRGYSLPASFPNTATPTDPTAPVPLGVLNDFDASAMLNGGTVYEDVISADIVADDMRTSLLAENIQVRKVPKMVVTFTPSRNQVLGGVPQYGDDYIVGDLVQFRAVEYGIETINAIFRVYGVDFTIDNSGAEIAVPILVAENA